MSNTQAKLDMAEAALESNSNDIAALEQNTVAINDEIADLKDKLKDEQKPKLRHGDYGIGGLCGRIVMRNNITDGGELTSAGRAALTGSRSPEGSMPEPILGNIFDDLEAMQKDLIKFTMESNSSPSTVKRTEVRLIGECVQIINDRGQCTNLWIETNPDFFKNIRQMEATLKRRKS